MGLFTLLARWWAPEQRRKHGSTDNASFSPQRLERRRVLDAAGAGVVMEALADPSEYVQASGIETEETSETPAVSTTTSNGPPTVIGVIPFLENSEEGGAPNLFLVQFSDPDINDTHTVVFDWGDGSPEETFLVDPGNRFLYATHVFQDDNPTNTPVDVTEIKVRVIDSAGQEAMGSTMINVSNVDPSIDSLSITTPVNEGDLATLTGTFSDPGLLDTFELDIDWDGDSVYDQTVSVSGGSFSVSQPISDDPNPPSSDTFDVNVRLRDDDTGADTESIAFTVNNVPPTLTISGDAMVDEGSLYTLNLSSSDPGDDTITSWEINWGDGNVEVVAGNPSSATHTYLDDGNYNITATATDEDGTFNANMIAVGVKNVPPTLTISGDAMVDEGSLYTLNLSSSDPGDDTITSWEINWGDGNVEVVAGNPSSATHTYLDDGNYNITATATDEDGTFNANMIAVGVKNVPPTVTIDGEPSTSPEGTQIDLTSTVMDPGTLDTFTYAWEVTFNGNVVAMGSDPSFSFTPADDGPYKVSLVVTDDDGGMGNDMVVINATNVDPTIVPIMDIETTEGTFISLPPAMFSDPGFDLAAAGTMENFTATIDWGDGTTEPAGDITLVEVPGSEGVLTTGTVQAMHAYADDGMYEVTLTVTDDNGGSAEAKFTVTVNNVDPTITPIMDIETTEGTFISLPPAMFSDPGFDLAAAGTMENFTATIDWGDGTTEPAGDITLVEVPGSEGVLTTGTVQAMHAYADDGMYEVTLTATDDNGGTAEAKFTVTVNNVDPTIVPIMDIDTTEGTFISLPPAMFSDPGFDLAAAGTMENFTATIDWGDGTTEPAGDITLVEVPGSEGVLTTGTVQAMHAYADDGMYEVTLTVTDDNGGTAEAKFTVTVKNVDPPIDDITDIDTTEGTFISLPPATFSDPGFDLGASGTFENFTATIDWGDGTTEPLSDITLVEVPGSQGVLTTGTIDAMHAYADDGVYEVTVTVTDDNGGSSQAKFKVTVANVAPTLTVEDGAQVVDEGEEFTLNDIGIGLTDPGFDNPLNPLVGGELQETFLGLTVDWGDGSAPMAISVDNVNDRVSGSEGVLTTATFTNAAYAYADNGTYTVTVEFMDDDGGFTSTSFEIEVNNVAPTLVLTDAVLVINEGDVLSLGDLLAMPDFGDLGTFSDPGFNNPNNPNAAPSGSVESFTYEINWGDGTLTETGELPASVMDGMQGTLTTGVLTDSHFYADNDGDNQYTITVTLFDDDGGSSGPQEIVVTVLNVNPVLNPIAQDDATDINTAGEVSVEVTFSDVGADELFVWVDWGDIRDPSNPFLPGADPYVLETVAINPSGASTFTITLTHTYAGPPNPLSPASDVEISVVIVDDDFSVATAGQVDGPLTGQPVVEPGRSEFYSVTVSNPGLGNTPIRIDTTPQVPRLTFPVRTEGNLFFVTTSSSEALAQGADLRSAAGDTKSTNERILQLQIVSATGEYSEPIRLKSEVLNDLPGLFRKLTNNHFVITLKRTETNSTRLVIEFFIRNGKAVNPNDDSDGTLELPPTEESKEIFQDPQDQKQFEELNNPEVKIDPTEDDQESVSQANGQEETLASSSSLEKAAIIETRSSRQQYATTIAAILAGTAGKSWAEQVDRSVADAEPRKWRQLRSHHRYRRKNQ